MNRRTLTTILLLILTSIGIQAQKFLKQVENKDVNIIMAGDYLSPFVPYLLKSYYRAYYAHSALWGYKPKKTYVFLNDLQDDGNGGACVTPFNFISTYVAPPSLHYNIMPNTERFQDLFNHEQTHVAMCDKTASRDALWRKIFLGKVSVNARSPLSAVASYLTTPRWYSPRWYQEGIAIFMETWLNGGVGRSLGNYDEMFFRTLIHDNQTLYTVTGLDAEGNAKDFQMGANSYLYGTRFVNYLALKYGVPKMLDFFNRKDGTRTMFMNQFKRVYGRSLSSVWNEWRDYEYVFQKENLDSIAKYPMTETKPLARNMGSASNVVYNSKRHEFVMGVDYPGKLSHVCAINRETGKMRKLAPVESSTIYNVCYVAVDEEGDRLFVTTQNNSFRGLSVYDMGTGKRLQKKLLTRVSSIVYNKMNKRLYGIMQNEGKVTLVYFSDNLDKEIALYTFKFGETISDLTISHDGSKLMACYNRLDGEQSLIEFDIKGMDLGHLEFKTIFHEQGTTLNQYSYSLDDSCVIGTSYYTGVANLWQINRNTGKFDLLTNVQTGLYSPIEYDKDSIFAMSFSHEGLRPVTLHRNILHDANPITFMGQVAYDKNPVLKEWTDMVKDIRNMPDTAHYNTTVTDYYSIHKLKLTGAYPDIAGFKSTVVAGYRMNFADPLGYHSLKTFVGISPWTNHETWKKIHLGLNWSYGFWSADAYLNKSDFYDLFGPTKVGRSGYSASVTYNRNYVLKEPFSWYWYANVGVYGLLDAMPLYQNISVDVNNMQSVTLGIGANKVRATTGAAQYESGYQWSATLSNYLVGGKMFNQIDATYEQGFLIPFVRNLSFWLRGAAGKVFGDENSSFAYTYFGGFRNNYVDYRKAYLYRETEAMPGAEIDEIAAREYGKLTGELIAPPIRFSNIGIPILYPKNLQFTAFSTFLATDPFNSYRENYINIGGQCSLEMVLFSYLKTTWSVGYAHMLHGFDKDKGQWMFSLKLLTL